MGGSDEQTAYAFLSVGGATLSLGNLSGAIVQYDEALAYGQRGGLRQVQAMALCGLATAYSQQRDQQKALEMFERALKLYRAEGDERGEARALYGLGAVYGRVGEREKALDFLNQALQLAVALGQASISTDVLGQMMLDEEKANPSLAIFHGKQSVNLIQQTRVNLQSADKALQASFLASKADLYRELAKLLIAQGRLPEAEQVEDLLKQQEYSEYVRGETGRALGEVTLTPEEQKAAADYLKSTAQLVALGAQWAELKKLSARTPEQEAQYAQLNATLTEANRGLSEYYKRLYVLFGQGKRANEEVATLRTNASVLQREIAKMPHTVALYTLVGDDRLRVIVVTGATMVAREYAISEADLNAKVAAFDVALRDPKTDPKPLAEELYKIVIGPVKADLEQAQATTLVWSLDGALRYVPLAALYDGDHYLVEQYETVTITPASLPYLGETPELTPMSAVAMGISRQYERELPPLPSVAGELNSIVKDPGTKGAHGVLDGKILLNSQFTEKAFEDELSSQHAVVHIASHFVFEPGDDSQSYLLLAGKDKDASGFHLTVAAFRDAAGLNLGETELLTLSACETGVSGKASNGREVDGLGATAQTKGAKAVISSLWEVDDESTGDLMADFYKRWATSGGRVMKVEALRQAQLDLLQGRVKPVEHPGFTDVPTSFAHPFYWAPFVLMGNWR